MNIHQLSKLSAVLANVIDHGSTDQRQAAIESWHFVLAEAQVLLGPVADTELDRFILVAVTY